MKHLLLAAATLTQGDTVNADSNVGIYVSARVTATIFAANNTTINSIVGVNGSNDSIAVGANDEGWLVGASRDSLTLAIGFSAFVSSDDVGVALSNFSHPAEIVDLLNGSGGYLSASAFGPLTSDVAGGLQRVLGDDDATAIAASIWDFG